MFTGIMSFNPPVDVIISHILQISKLRLREIKKYIHCCKTSKKQSKDSKSLMLGCNAKHRTVVFKVSFTKHLHQNYMNSYQESAFLGNNSANP